MESGLELGAVVRLHDVHAEREPTNDFIDELRGRALIAGIVDLEDANPRAIVDGRELVQPLLGARDSFQKLHIHL